MSEENRDMNEQTWNWKTPRLSEDLKPTLTGDTPHYAYTTNLPVVFVEVAGAEGVLGYMWFCDADDAAGYVPRDAAGDDAYNEGVTWSARLRACKAEGHPPTRALAELTTAESESLGKIVPGSEREAPDLEALKALANPESEKKQQQSDPRRRTGGRARGE